jgi:cytochrome c biogenesis protein CcmG, thiol:disulfide interchange protein DsbE
VCGAARTVPQIGEAAPPLVLTTIDGGTFDLGKLHGKVVLVNYWATWCAPCRKEMPKLDAFYRKYHSQGLEIVGISIDFDRDLAKARKVASSAARITFAWRANPSHYGARDAMPAPLIGCAAYPYTVRSVSWSLHVEAPRGLHSASPG